MPIFNSALSHIIELIKLEQSVQFCINYVCRTVMSIGGMSRHYLHIFTATLLSR